jgi:hypothetical protein
MNSPQLMTLFDMLKNYSTIFSDLMTGLLDIEFCLSQYDDRELTKKISKAEDDKISQCMHIAIKMAGEMNLDAAEALLVRMHQSKQRGYTKIALCVDVKDLRSRIEDQLKARHFLFVDQNLVDYYKHPTLFGQQVNDNFPNAIDDIQDAGSCLALGQGTACVMHLMRVMESGLKALAKELKIPYAPSWESYLTQIEKNIAAKRSTKSKAWIKTEKFYRDVSGDLLTIKQAWRNPTMHIDRRYEPEEAENILKAVKALMQRIATKLKS